MKNSKTENIETPITSMIDVVFLLIIFFVVTSDIDRESVDDKVKLAKSTYLEPVTKLPKNRAVVNVRASGEIMYGAIPRSMATLTRALKQAHAIQGAGMVVIVRGHGDVRYEKIDEVVQAVTNAGLSRIKISAQDTGLKDK